MSIIVWSNHTGTDRGLMGEGPFVLLPLRKSSGPSKGHLKFAILCWCRFESFHVRLYSPTWRTGTGGAGLVTCLPPRSILLPLICPWSFLSLDGTSLPSVDNPSSFCFVGYALQHVCDTLSLALELSTGPGGSFNILPYNTAQKMQKLPVVQ